ncbi:hypothetical protein [Maribacter dokdonensis]|uniref:hypothetical protein n=1 Tax=Maribacter dokdonensis TaxID=320912 RepID=UPI0007199634|nr:hypothetical protein [Maribacter dokdonensis]KSA14481.1 hypothetical protein I600_1082 [Maribacter dokdonensis DSW-8]
MPKYIFILIAISLISFSGYGQDNTVILKGTVSNAKNDVSNVLIVNLNTQQSTITDSFGLFSIEVRLKDSLRISAVQYLPKEIIINESYLNSSFVTIHLIENIIDLKEVTVTPYNLTGELDRDIDRLDIKPTTTSYTLGLQNADFTKMTQSERLLQEADRGKYVKLATTDEYGKVFEILGYAALTVVINTHKIANRVSGRTKSLEKMVERDEKKQLEKEIIDKFSKQTMSENFKIPVSYIDGFLTYCLSQDDFIALKNAGNTIEIWEYLKTKSIDYKTTEEFEN